MPLIYNATNNTEKYEKEIQFLLKNYFPWLEGLTKKLKKEEERDLTRVFEFLQSQAYHLGYSHAKKDSPCQSDITTFTTTEAGKSS